MTGLWLNANSCHCTLRSKPQTKIASSPHYSSSSAMIRDSPNGFSKENISPTSDMRPPAFYGHFGLAAGVVLNDRFCCSILYLDTPVQLPVKGTEVLVGATDTPASVIRGDSEIEVAGGGGILTISISTNSTTMWCHRPVRALCRFIADHHLRVQS